MRFLLPFPILFAMLSPLYSDDANLTGGFLGMDFAMLCMDLGPLNGRLASYGYPAVNDLFFCPGGGGGVVYHGFYLGGRGFGSLPVEVKNGGSTLSWNSSYGMFDLGYVVPISPDFFLVPTASLGGGGITVTVYPNSLSDSSLDHFLSDPKQGSVLTYNSLVAGIGLLASVHFGTWDVQLSGGWYYYPSDGLRFNGTLLSGVPDMPRQLFTLSAGFRIGRIGSGN
jgi:hypothetical protein